MHHVPRTYRKRALYSSFFFSGNNTNIHLQHSHFQLLITFQLGFWNHYFINLYFSENLAVITYFIAFDLSQLLFHTINSSRSAYQSINFRPSFFDVYTVSNIPVQCSVLLKVRMVFSPLSFYTILNCVCNWRMLSNYFD